MGEYFSKFFDTSDFPRRWNCGNWSDFLGWLHILSDLATVAAYFAIPAVLFYFVRRRRDFPFSKLFWLFGAFIFACGTVHLIEAIIFWYPIYRVSGALKFITAVVSWSAVVALVRYAPRAAALPSMAETNERLKKEINQRRATERMLRESKERLNAILSGTRSIVWTTDPQGGFATPQISWERYTGQSWDEHQGLGWAKVIHEEDLPDLRRRWDESLKSGRKHQASFRLWHEDTRSFRACVAEAVPVRNEDGSTREWVGTVSDVEDQLRAETDLGVMQSELAKQKRELELIYDAAPFGMCLIDQNLRILRINNTLAEIGGFSRDEHFGRASRELLPDVYSQLEPIYKQVFTSRRPVLDTEIRGVTPADHKSHTWLASCFPLELDAEPDSAELTAVAAVAVFMQDITERKKQEARILKSEQAALTANRAKSEFLANMSHEIRTPMSAVLGYADVLLGHLHDPDNRNCVMIMKRNGEHLLALINDILDLSRIEAGKLDVNVQPTPLPQLVADIQSLMAVRAEEKKVRFEAVFSGRVPRAIRTDPTRLRQVLINLIGNAIKFTDEGSVLLKVRFVEGAEPPMIEFAIQDTGVGITEEQQQRLFNPFTQGDSSVNRKFGGSGLGLAISHRLVDILGGELDLNSTPGKGSTFYVRLPVSAVEDIELVQPSLIIREAEPEALTAEPPNLSCHILVVDDRRDVRHISQHFLEKAGAKVTVAEDGQQGMDIALAAREAGTPFDLIVMDMQMPKVDGLRATSELRSAGIDWPIIALTADAMKGDRDRCLNGGCDDYLSKPIDHAKLIRMAAEYTQQVDLQVLKQRRALRIAKLQDELESSD